MLANTLSFKAAWANIRALPGEVMKPVSAALLVMCAVQSAVKMLDTSQQGTVTFWLWVGVLFLLGTMISYAVNRMIAAHDRGERMSPRFLVDGFFLRLLFPVIALSVLAGTAAGIVMLPIAMFAYWALPSSAWVSVILALFFYPVLLYVILRLICVSSVVAFEDTPLFTALSRSWRMTSGRFWAVLRVWLATLMVISVTTFLWTVLLMLFGMPFPSDVAEPEPTTIKYVFTFGCSALTVIPSALLAIGIYRVLRDGEAAEAAEA